MGGRRKGDGHGRSLRVFSTARGKSATTTGDGDSDALWLFSRGLVPQGATTPCVVLSRRLAQRSESSRLRSRETAAGKAPERAELLLFLFFFFLPPIETFRATVTKKNGIQKKNRRRTAVTSLRSPPPPPIVSEGEAAGGGSDATAEQALTASAPRRAAAADALRGGDADDVAAADRGDADDTVGACRAGAAGRLTGEPPGDDTALAREP